ncbi:MAG TPA: hypothetical protein VEK31_08865, partial [Xanthobacteraceae bacterium]|nr:hypothetical protein [Xanthobacteraceae bacterium]
MTAATTTIARLIATLILLRETPRRSACAKELVAATGIKMSPEDESAAAKSHPLVTGLLRQFRLAQD